MIRTKGEAGTGEEWGGSLASVGEVGLMRGRSYVC